MVERKIESLTVAFDFSDNSKHAVLSAAAIARETGAEIRVLTALPGRIDPKIIANVEQTQPEDKARGRLRNKATILAQAETRVRAEMEAMGLGDLNIVYDIQYRRFPHVMLVVADLFNPDLLIVGATSRGSGARMLGTDTERLVRKSLWAVLVTKPNKPVLPKRILCPVDFSNASERALGWAFQIAQTSGAEVEVLHILDDMDDIARYFEVEEDKDPGPSTAEHVAREKLNALLQRLPTPEGVKLTQTVRSGIPHEAIINQAYNSEADLISIGTLGRSGIMEVLIGGTSERVLRALPCSILAVKPDEFVYKFTDKL